MRDQDLSGDGLKLVRYKLLFVKRDYEVAFPECEELVSDSMTGDAFAAWKLSEFVQSLARGETPVPRSWAGRNYPPPEFIEGGKLKGLPDKDRKHLRLYYEVLDRYVRETEERDVDILKEIRAAVDRSNASRDE
jgi:hypothetical protein